MIEGRDIVAVMGSGTEAHRELAEPLGRCLAARGCHLLTGAGAGAMRAVAEAFVSTPGRVGLSIGVVPGWIDDRGAHHDKPGYPNAFVEIAIRTHLPLSGEQGEDPRSRNHVNVLSASAVVIVPGGAGTRSEAVLAERYGRAVIAFGPPEAFATFPPTLPRAPRLADVERFLDHVLAPAS